VIHLDQRLFDARFTPAITLDDRRLERQFAQLGHLQSDLACLGLERALVVAGASIHPVRTVLVTPGSAKLVGLRIEHRIKGLFHGRSDHLVQMLSHKLLVDLDYFSHGFIGCRGASRGWFIFGHRYGFRFGLSGYPFLRRPFSKCAKLPGRYPLPLIGRVFC